MNYWESHTQVAVRFRRFDRKRYAAFRSMHKVINIGVVTASMLLFALPDTAQAQKTIEPNRTGEEASVELEEVEVTASRAPIARNQATKIVTVIPAREIATAPVTSIQDLLEYAAGIDVRQRGEGGTQADISIRGGTFDQIAVLLNGVNLSNPQTGHYSFDLPVNLSDIERIEVVSGPSSRIFGASAFAGAINIITKTGKENRISTDNYAGMHKLWKLEAAINHATTHFGQRLSAGYASSGGYIDNTDFKQLNLFGNRNLKARRPISNSKPDTTTKVMERIASTPLPTPTNTTRLAAFSSPPEEKHMAKSSSPPRYTGPDISTGTSCSVAIPPIGIPGIITMRRKYSEPTSTPRHSGN